MNRATLTATLFAFLLGACDSALSATDAGTGDAGADAGPSGCMDGPRELRAELTYARFEYEDQPGWATRYDGTVLALAFVEPQDTTNCAVRLRRYDAAASMLSEEGFLTYCQSDNWNSHNYLSLAASPDGYALAYDTWRSETASLTPDRTYYTNVDLALFDRDGLGTSAYRQNTETVWSSVSNEVRAFWPAVEWLGDRYALVWNDYRYNDPAPQFGQQFDLPGLYGHVFTSGDWTSFGEEQVYQSGMYMEALKAIAGDAEHTVVVWQGGTPDGAASGHDVWMNVRYEPSSFVASDRILLTTTTENVQSLTVATDGAGTFAALVLGADSYDSSEAQLIVFQPGGTPAVHAVAVTSGTPMLESAHLAWAGDRFVALWEEFATWDTFGDVPPPPPSVHLATFDVSGALLAERVVPPSTTGWVSSTRLDGDAIELVWIDRADGSARVDIERVCLP